MSDQINSAIHQENARLYLKVSNGQDIQQANNTIAAAQVYATLAVSAAIKELAAILKADK